MNVIFKILITLLALVALIATPSKVAGQARTNPDSALQTILDQLQGTPLPLQQAVQHA